MQELVSIIVPVYNGENRICRALNSIKKQSYKNLEVIIVDDGSTDETRRICEAYVKEDSRFQLVHIENGGVANAKNVGIEHATGTYLQFLDHDDYFLGQCTSKLVKAIEEDETIDMVVGTYTKRYKGYIVHQGNMEKAGRYSAEKYLVNTLVDPGHFYYGVNWNKIYRMDCIKKNGIKFDVNVNLGEDFIFNLQVMKHARNISVIKDCLVLYDCRSSGLSRNSIFGIERCKNELSNRKKIWERYIEAFDFYGIREEYWDKMQEYWLNFKVRQKYNLDYNFLDWDQDDREQWNEIIDSDPIIEACVVDAVAYTRFYDDFYKRQQRKDRIKKVITFWRF